MKYLPRFCVWELTLACNAKCIHCGSRAGAPRERELSTGEAIAMIEALGELGCESVTLSGGEPFIRKDWPKLAEAIRGIGIRLEAITNGLCVAQQAEIIATMDFDAVSFSVDGTQKVHNRLRGVQGGLERLLQGADALKKRGVRIGAVTQVNKLNLSLLSDIHRLLVEHGFEGWQLQLTMPYGRAVDNKDDVCLGPDELLTLERRLSEIWRHTPIFVQTADNIGYMGRIEPLLRGGSGATERFWRGCSAGLSVIGVTSDGTVRGCLSMPSALDEGNLREKPLREIWFDENAFAYNRRFSTENLRDHCADCALSRLCRAGCKSMAFIYTGTPFSNPMCLRHLYDRVTVETKRPHTI